MKTTGWQIFSTVSLGMLDDQLKGVLRVIGYLPARRGKAMGVGVYEQQCAVHSVITTVASFSWELRVLRTCGTCFELPSVEHELQAGLGFLRCPTPKGEQHAATLLQSWLENALRPSTCYANVCLPSLDEQCNEKTAGEKPFANRSACL